MVRLLPNFFMTSRRQKFLVVTLLLLSVLLTLLIRDFTKTPEPTYQGKTVSQLFAEFRAARTNYQHSGHVSYVDPVSKKLVRATTKFDDTDAWLRGPAAIGLRALGTNALPFLEGELQRRDGGWVRGYRAFYQKLPPSLRTRAPVPSAGRDSIRADAAIALAALGTNAQSAVPMILEIIRTERFFGMAWGLTQGLQKMPYESAAFDPLLRDYCARSDLDGAVYLVERFKLLDLEAAMTLTNALLSPKIRLKQNVFAELTRFAQYGAIVVPALVAVLTSGNAPDAADAANVLRKLHTQAEHAVPALVNALTNRSDEVRYGAVSALEAFGTNSLAALPALITATNDSSVMVRSAALRALDKLDLAKPISN